METKSNNWEVWHDTNWTEFELHSAVFGHLRKHLYPNYLVRGTYVFITAEGEQMRPDIAIFKRLQGLPAKLELIVEVKGEQSTSSEKQDLKQYEKYKKLGVPLIYVRNRVDFKNVLEEVKKHLMRATGSL